MTGNLITRLSPAGLIAGLAGASALRAQSPSASAVRPGAPAGNANVKALVHVAAFAPDAGEPVGAYFEKFPSALGQALRPDAAGFVYIDRARLRDLFARDVPAAEASVTAATRKPIIGSAFGSSVERAASAAAK